MRKIFLSMIVAVMGFAAQAQAIPSLQLDIAGGSYVSGSETIVSPGNTFTLYALLSPTSQNKVADKYYISAALIPQQKLQNPAPDLGSFSFGGQKVMVTGDMFYGTPPVEDLMNKLSPSDPNDLSSHGIYDTYYKEFSFNFTQANQISSYNTADRAVNGQAIPTSGAGLYYATFVVDLSSLAEGYGIHFDLYNEAMLRTKKGVSDLDVNNFAPFSHDAEGMYRRGGGGDPGGDPVPEPATLVLTGIGIAIAGLYARKKKA